MDWFPMPGMTQCLTCQACLVKFPCQYLQLFATGFLWTQEPTLLSLGRLGMPGKWCGITKTFTRDPGQLSSNNWQELMNKHSNSGLVSRSESALRSRANQLKPLKAFYLWYQRKYIQKNFPDPTPKGPIAIYPCSCTPRIRKWLITWGIFGRGSEQITKQPLY